MVLRLLLIGVLFNPIILVWQVENNGEEMKKRENDITVQSLGEVLDFWEVGFKQVELLILSFEVLRKFGNVECFDVIETIVFQPTSTASSSVVVCRCIVTFVLGILVYWKREEVFGKVELVIHLFLSQAIVLHIEKPHMLNRVFQLFGQSLLSPCSVVVFEIKGYQLGLVKLLLRLGGMDVSLKVLVVVLCKVWAGIFC